MSLTVDDKTFITDSITEAIQTLVIPRFDELDKRLTRVEVQLIDIQTRLSRVERVQAEHSKILAEHSRILDEHSKILAEHSKTLAEHGKALAEHGKLLREHSEQIEANTAEILGLRNDVKDIYDQLQTPVPIGMTRSFEKLSEAAQIRLLHSWLQQLAAQCGVKLLPE